MITTKNVYRHEKKLAREFSSIRKKLTGLTISGSTAGPQGPTGPPGPSRGVAVFVSATEPTEDIQLNDIWIQIN